MLSPKNIYLYISIYKFFFGFCFVGGMGGSSSSNYFSLGQWQELELQALIYRHMLAGASVPPELLHLVKKSLFNSSSSAHHHPYNYLTHHPLHHHYPHFQSAAACKFLFSSFSHFSFSYFSEQTI